MWRTNFLKSTGLVLKIVYLGFEGCWLRIWNQISKIQNGGSNMADEILKINRIGTENCIYRFLRSLIRNIKSDFKNPNGGSNMVKEIFLFVWETSIILLNTPLLYLFRFRLSAVSDWYVAQLIPTCRSTVKCLFLFSFFFLSDLKKKLMYTASRPNFIKLWTNKKSILQKNM